MPDKTRFVADWLADNIVKSTRSADTAAPGALPCTHAGYWSLLRETVTALPLSCPLVNVTDAVVAVVNSKASGGDLELVTAMCECLQSCLAKNRNSMRPKLDAVIRLLTGLLKLFSKEGGVSTEIFEKTIEVVCATCANEAAQHANQKVIRISISSYDNTISIYIHIYPYISIYIHTYPYI